MAAAAANGTGKNKYKPVSTVEPFQRQLHPTGAVPKGEDLHNNINKNHHGQPNVDEKDTTKYQTLPFGSNVRYNNSIQNKKDLQNVRFSEVPATTSDYQRSYLSTDHQGNYAATIENNNISKTSGLKPMNSVAPVIMQSTNQSRDSSLHLSPSVHSGTSACVVVVDDDVCRARVWRCGNNDLERRQAIPRRPTSF